MSDHSEELWLDINGLTNQNQKTEVISDQSEQLLSLLEKELMTDSVQPSSITSYATGSCLQISQ